jgi:DnaJ-class molecular chaperone
MQVNSAASKDTLSRAFARLNRLDDSEFSAETLEARTHLLKVALDVLSDNTGRRIYDNAVQTGSYEASALHIQMQRVASTAMYSVL